MKLTREMMQKREKPCRYVTTEVVSVIEGVLDDFGYATCQQVVEECLYGVKKGQVRDIARANGYKVTSDGFIVRSAAKGGGMAGRKVQVCYYNDAGVMCSLVTDEGLLAREGGLREYGVDKDKVQFVRPVHLGSSTINDLL